MLHSSRFRCYQLCTKTIHSFLAGASFTAVAGIQKKCENSSHAPRSININLWLVYFCLWNIHSWGSFFQLKKKGGNKLFSEAITWWLLLIVFRTSRSVHNPFCLMPFATLHFLKALRFNLSVWSLFILKQYLTQQSWVNHWLYLIHCLRKETRT